MSKIKNEKIRSEALSLLTRLANGWRMPQKDKIISVMHVDVTLSLLSEKVHVQKPLYLIWIVDIIEEDEKWVQVVKVFDVLPESKTTQLKQNLEIYLKSYTNELINRCNYRFIVG